MPNWLLVGLQSYLILHTCLSPAYKSSAGPPHPFRRPILMSLPLPVQWNITWLFAFYTLLPFGPETKKSACEMSDGIAKCESGRRIGKICCEIKKWWPSVFYFGVLVDPLVSGQRPRQVNKDSGATFCQLRKQTWRVGQSAVHCVLDRWLSVPLLWRSELCWPGKHWAHWT